MKTTIQLVLIASAILFMTGCSSSKNTAIKANNNPLEGKWIISNISVNVPPDYKVTDVFDEGPYEDFKGSSWDLIRNGKGTLSLLNGTKEDIYWSIFDKGDSAQFQFKKLKGMKPKNVSEGYRLQLQDISSNSFIAKSPVDLGDGKTGSITYTFTK